MKVLHVTPSFYPARHYGGTSYSGHALCKALAEIPDIEIRVLTTDSDGPKLRQRMAIADLPMRLAKGYDVFYCRRLLGKAVSLSMMWRLWPMIRWADIVHLSAIYSSTTIPTLFLCKLLDKPVVWSTHGALQRWSGSTRRATKRIWELICDSLCDPERILLHATSEEERNETVRRITRAQATVVPNGTDVPELINGKKDEMKRPTLLYLGRLHPIKGIENLLHALTMTDRDVQLSICGDGESSYRKSLEMLCDRLQIAERVTFYGLVEASERERHFQNSDLCVVPSHKEAFCLVVSESLSYGVPVIVSRHTPWKNVDAIGCGLCVDNDPVTLSKAIENALKMPLTEMGQRGREWILCEYSWGSVAQRIATHYKDLISYPLKIDRSQQPTILDCSVNQASENCVNSKIASAS